MLSQVTVGVSTTPVAVCPAVAGRAVNLGTIYFANTLATGAILQLTDGPGGPVLVETAVPGGGGGGIEDTGTSVAGKPCSDFRTSPGNGLYAVTLGPASVTITTKWGRL